MSGSLLALVRRKSLLLEDVIHYVCKPRKDKKIKAHISYYSVSAYVNYPS